MATPRLWVHSPSLLLSEALEVYLGSLGFRTQAGAIGADAAVFDLTMFDALLPPASGAVTDDDVELTGGSATFNDKNVANGKTITGTGFSLDGDDANNYSLASTTLTTTADITPLGLSISAVDHLIVWPAPKPVFNVTYGDFVAGESETVLGGELTFTGTAVDAPNPPLPGTYTITPGGLTSNNYALTFEDGTLTVTDESAPFVTNVHFNPNPVAVGTPTTLSAEITDVGAGSSNIASAEYSFDGLVWSAMILSDLGSPTTAATAVITNLQVGVYTACVRATDVAGNRSDGTACVFIAVFDPAAGHVTGGGWINSPVGASTTFPDLTGRANFGFNARYQRGANLPDGQTQFQFQAGNLNFHSTSYQWLVVTGNSNGNGDAGAKFKGEGTINGSGRYEFMLTAIDGGKDRPDEFWIKIVDKNSGDIVYDNNQGASDDAYSGTGISGGNIQIHQPNQPGGGNNR